MRVIEETLYSGLLDGAIDSFDLSVGPRMVRLGEAVFDSVDMAGTDGRGSVRLAPGDSWEGRRSDRIIRHSRLCSSVRFNILTVLPSYVLALTKS